MSESWSDKRLGSLERPGYSFNHSKFSLDNASGETIESGQFMRNNGFTKLLVGLLVVFVLATSALTFLYVRSVQKLNRLQLQNALIVRNRALVNSLAAESIEYSKRNPALDPVLQSVGIKPKGSGAPSQPASRP